MPDSTQRSPTVGKANRTRPRILFVAEAATLAHVARPMVLAQSLDPEDYEVHFACANRYRGLFGDLPFDQIQINSASSERFLARMASGSPLFDVETLRAYVREDLEVIERIAPELVVGDLRFSLAVSTQIAGLPYMTISNAYWSPSAGQRFPLPDLDWAKWLGVPASRLIFGALRPLAFAYHTLPLNRVRRDYGLSPLGYDLRRMYTHADHTLYADIPELAPTVGLPAHQHYLGPILWSPSVELPEWWEKVPNDRSIIYVTIGSSGRRDVFAAALDAVAEMPVTVIASTAGRVARDKLPTNIFVADYLPGDEACARASVVICNGGSPTTYQALTAGKPVVGIASNMDQYLNIQNVQRVGAGKLLRAATADPAMIRRALNWLLNDPKFATGAARMSKFIARYDAPTRFRTILQHIFPKATDKVSIQTGRGKSVKPI